MGKKLGVACYGVNGHQVVASLTNHPRARLVAVSEIPLEDQVGAEAAAGVRQEKDLEALIAADDVELISLCSPRRDEQCEQALQCLRAGKHVLAEKPAALTMEDLDRLLAGAAECKAQFRQMGGCHREATLAGIRKLVDDGRLGQVVQVYALKSYPYHDRRPQDRGVDGGIIRQAGIHAVRAIQLASGLKAVRVCGFDTGRGNPKDGDLQLGASVSLELEGGAVAVMACNYCNPAGIGYWGNDQVRVHGTGGMAEAVDGFGRCVMVIGDAPPEAIPAIPESYPSFFDSYVDYLLDGTPMPYSEQDDIHALRTVIRAQEAVEKGCVLDV